MSGAPAAGAANGPANRNTPSECTSGDARTVVTTARLVRSSLRSARGPVDSPHPAAVSSSSSHVIGLMRLDPYYPRQRGPRHSGLLLERRRSESNRRIEVLQTSALPLGYGARASKVTKTPGFLNPASSP